MIPPYAPPTLEDICARWHHAIVANRVDVWRAVSKLLSGEASMCVAYKFDEMAADLCTLSDVAHRRHLDLYPTPEPEPA